MPVTGQSRKMALEIVSRFFDVYRQNGGDGEQILRTAREKISSSFRTSSLGIKNNETRFSIENNRWRNS